MVILHQKQRQNIYIITMTLSNLIFENHKHDYGCVMLYFDFPEIKTIHNIIKPNDIYEDPYDDSYGLETEPHVSLLFGLHNEVTTDNVKNVLKKFTFGPCRLTNVSTFDGPPYDVLKYDIDGDGLHEANAELRKFPHTTNFPEYHPHLTIAYLKTGKGKKYTDALKNSSFTLLPKFAVYSKTNGTKEKLSITTK